MPANAHLKCIYHYKTKHNRKQVKFTLENTNVNIYSVHCVFKGIPYRAAINYIFWGIFKGNVRMTLLMSAYIHFFNSDIPSVNTLIFINKYHNQIKPKWSLYLVKITANNKEKIAKSCFQIFIEINIKITDAKILDFAWYPHHVSKTQLPCSLSSPHATSINFV